MILTTITNLINNLNDLLDTSDRALLIVADIPSPYLPETWVSIDTLNTILSLLSYVSQEVYLYLHPLVGSIHDLTDKVRRYIHSKCKIISFDHLPKERMKLYNHRGKPTIEVEVLTPNEIGLRTLILSCVRTSSFSALILSSFVPYLYMVKPNSITILDQGPLYTNVNAVVVYLYISPICSILDLSRIIECDGPIHGYVKKYKPIILIGRPPYVADIAVAECAGITLDRIPYLSLIASLLGIDISDPDFKYLRQLIDKLKVKIHSLEPRVRKARTALPIKREDMYLKLTEDHILENIRLLKTLDLYINTKILIVYRNS